MREKSLLKKKVNREHSGNFSLGFVNVHQEYLHKAGIRGRKLRIIYIFIAILFIVAATNLLITCTIFGVLKIDHHGMALLEVSEEGLLIRFLQKTNIDVVHPLQNQIYSRPSKSMSIAASDGSEVKLEIKETNTSVIINKHKLSLASDDGLNVLDPDTGNSIFSRNSTVFTLSEAPNSITSKNVYTEQVLSPPKEDITFESESSSVHINASDEVEVEGLEVQISTLNDVSLSSDEQLIIDGGEDGIFLNQVRNMQVTSRGGISADISYKLCVCVPSGLVFGVEAPLGCDEASEVANPCA